MIATLLATFLRVGLVGLAAFAIIVLMEHGPRDFLQGARQEAAALADFARQFGKARPPIPAPTEETDGTSPSQQPIEPPPSQEAAPSPATSDTHEKSSSIARWQELQEQPTGNGTSVDEPVNLD